MAADREQGGHVGTMTTSESTQNPSAANATPEAPAIKHSRENPFSAPVIEKRLLTHIASSKSTVHLVFSTKGSNIEYEVGDSCGVIPQNDPQLISDILRVAHFSEKRSFRSPSLVLPLCRMHWATTSWSPRSAEK